MWHAPHGRFICYPLVPQPNGSPGREHRADGSGRGAGDLGIRRRRPAVSSCTGGRAARLTPVAGDVGPGIQHSSGAARARAPEPFRKAPTNTSVIPIALTIEILPESLAISRLSALDAIPPWANIGTLVSHTRTADELSVVCAQAALPAGVRAAPGWRALKLVGPFDLSAVGVLVSVAAPLAEAGISILPLGTFDTDYVLVAESQLQAALEVLEGAGHWLHTARLTPFAGDVGLS